MSPSISHARDTIRRCRAHRDAHKVEAVLRSEIDSRLRLIFPSHADQSWINHYTTGAEAHTPVAVPAGGSVARFIDNLVGATTIEYESDLRISARRETGLMQVREHMAGLIGAGAVPSQVRGVLSDTVEWYAYEVTIPSEVISRPYTAEDIQLRLVDELSLGDAGERSARRLIAFLRRHLARQQSRPLKADHLTLDLGLESETYRRTSGSLSGMIRAGRSSDPSIELATSLWSEFVDYLETGTGGFRATAYTDEVYLLILARLLGANVLSEHAHLSDDAELKGILDGSHFRENYQLENMVELDYFGWLTSQPHVEKVIPIAREIQRDLYAYDYGHTLEADLFGRLMGQLASRSQRRLLGQEVTPAWLARHVADYCIDSLPNQETPRFLDMCCGSGTILAEVLRSTKDRRGLSGIADLLDVVTGFDIDPLAVSLAKTTWVVALKSEIRSADSAIVIPIYHADSLFAVTPVSSAVPFFEDEKTLDVSLDGVTVALPYALVQPTNREVFDRIIDWALAEARDAQVARRVPEFAAESVAGFLDGASLATGGTKLSEDTRNTLVPAVQTLVHRMAELAVAGRNGIWAFVLRNTYRPGLLAGEFNGLVSNPPWLAMSSLADNPYKDMLTRRARLYGVRPAGSSFLHLELATIHLLHAVDRYLKPGAPVACLLPQTVVNGNHHEAFRQRQYLRGERSVPLEISQVWEVESGTFKVPGVAVAGYKRSSVAECTTVPIGAIAFRGRLEERELQVTGIGTARTAWILRETPTDSTTVTASGTDAEVKRSVRSAPRRPQQGADLMPRIAVCIELLSDNRRECRVITPNDGTPWGFAVKKAKKLKGASFPGHVAQRFIYRMAQSENLLPFALGRHRAPIAIPAVRDGHGKWDVYDDVEIRRLGFVHTARRFQTINEMLRSTRGGGLQRRINERGKLVRQVFREGGHLVLSGAGGTRICAAWLPVADAQDLIIDQTLYWDVLDDVNEARFYVAMLNSHAMTEAIRPFNPRGALGPRHVHTLPYRLMPTFDRFSECHLQVVSLAGEVASMAESMIGSDDYLDDPNRMLHIRRSRLRDSLGATAQMQEIERLCAPLLLT